MSKEFMQNHQEDLEKIVLLRNEAIHPLCIERISVALLSRREEKIMQSIRMYLNSYEANNPATTIGICVAHGRLDLTDFILDVIQETKALATSDYFSMLFLFANIHQDIYGWNEGGGGEEESTLKDIFIRRIRDNVDEDVITRILILGSIFSTSGFYRLLEWFYDTPDKVPEKMEGIFAMDVSESAYRIDELAYMKKRGYGKFFVDKKAVDNEEEEELARAIAESLKINPME